ncbi:MAG: baseplate J/gp47 family protein [Burkholderiaceae bacterium]|jgi:uncharacterized phage protein gp47/JayE|nr:baseplate J/gp47 family protein [Burkholderiaceae bacterium]
MTTNTNVPDLNFGPGGVTAPSESQILDGVLTDLNAAFGGGLNISNLFTPQGQLASSLTAIIGKKNSELMLYVNQVDPLYAQGRMQDAIGRIYFLERKPAMPTVVTVTCIGATGTVIPVGALAADAQQNIYACTQAATIDSTGSVDLPFANQQTGPIPCPPGSISGMYQSIAGWDKAFNAQEGVLGNDVESRAEFEFRRKNSVAINALGTLPSIYANVFSVPDVLDVYCTENTTSNTLNAGATSYPLKPHSIYVAVSGGDAQAIGEAIWRKKSMGADYNGNTSVTVTDTSGYEQPLPTYTVLFERPTSAQVNFAVTLAASAALPGDIVSQVQNAIIGAFAGSDGGTRARIGSTVFASRFYAPVMAIADGVEIVSILLGIGAATQNVLDIGIDVAPTVSAQDITVTVMQV